jgi:hypothetical protein
VEQGQGKSATLAGCGDMPRRCCSVHLNSRSDKSNAGKGGNVASRAADGWLEQVRRRVTECRPPSEAPLQELKSASQPLACCKRLAPPLRYASCLPHSAGAMAPNPLAPLHLRVGWTI